MFEIELALDFGEVLVTLQVVEDGQVGDDDLLDGLLVLGIEWKFLDVEFFYSRLFKMCSFICSFCFLRIYFIRYSIRRRFFSTNTS